MHKKLWMESAGPLVSVAMMGYIALKCLWKYSWDFVDSAQPYSLFIFNTRPLILLSGSIIPVPSPVSHYFNISPWVLIRYSILLSLCKQSEWHCSRQACLFLVLHPVLYGVSDFLIFVVWSHSMSWTMYTQLQHFLKSHCALACPLHLVLSLLFPILDFSVFSPATSH